MRTIAAVVWARENHPQITQSLRNLWMVFAVLGVCAFASAQEVSPDDVIRVKTTLVNSPVLVIGRDGKFVPTLRREDFEVYENGVKQEIAYFAPVENPFTVAILIDTSRSALFDLQDIRDAATAFVDKMRPNDRALVIAFSTDVTVVAEPTSDHAALHRAISDIRPGGNTRVYDALNFALAERLAKIEGRTAVLLFTDGVDNDSHTATFESALQQAARADALIYPVQFSTYDYIKARSPSSKFQPPPGTGFSEADYQKADVFLHQLANTSGTGVYPAFDISDLDRAIESIVDELHNEYSIGYYPRTQGKPGEERSVEVRVNQPQLAVRARSGYVVDRSGTTLRTPKKQGVIVFGALNSPGNVPVARPEEAPPPDGRWVCKGPDAPTDLAVVKEGFISHCPQTGPTKEQPNAWFIRKPGPSETVCKGFVALNGREIAGAPIPAGYVVTGEVKASACANSSDAAITKNAWEIRLPRENDVVCKGFPLPRGFAVANERSTPACPAMRLENNAWVIRATKN